MLTLKELRNKMNSNEIQIDEAIVNDLPALLVLKRGTIRVLPSGKRVAEYSHEPSGFSIIYPMMFSKGDKR